MANVVKHSGKLHLQIGTLDEDLNIICGQDALKITLIKPSGSALMDFTSFVNGRQTRPGDRFSQISQKE
jgi:hypothetical protein